MSAHRPSGPQARQLPGIPQARQLPEIPGSSGDPLDIDRRPPAQLPSDVGIMCVYVIDDPLPKHGQLIGLVFMP